MLLLVVLLLSTSVYGQPPLYGPSQLDHYARLINSGNLGGFGWFKEALDQVRNPGKAGFFDHQGS